MPDTAPPATSQPAPPAQTSDAKVSDNLSGSQARNALLKGFIARQAADAPAAPVVEKVTPAPPAEVAEPATTVTEPATTPEQQPATTEPAPVPAEPVPETEPVTTEPDDLSGEPGADVLSQLSSLDPQTRELVQGFLDKQKEHTHANVQKRIDKERALRGHLEKEITALKANSPKPEIVRVPMPTANEPLADVADVQTLTQRHSEAKEAKAWAQETLDGENWEQMESGGKLVDAIKYGDRYYTKSEIKGVLRNAERALDTHIPARLSFLQKRQNAQTQAFAEFPFLKDKNSVEYQQAEKARADFPWLNSVPEADWFIGAAILGHQTLEARRAAAKTAAGVKPKAVPAQKPPASQTAVPATASAARTTGDQAAKRAVAAEREKLGTKGNVSGDDLRRYFLNSSLSR